MWFNRHTTDRNYSGEQKVNFESPVPFSKCLRAKSYSNTNVHFDPQDCQTLLIKESEHFLLSLGSWTTTEVICPKSNMICRIAYVHISLGALYAFARWLGFFAI